MRGKLNKAALQRFCFWKQRKFTRNFKFPSIKEKYSENILEREMVNKDETTFIETRFLQKKLSFVFFLQRKL